MKTNTDPNRKSKSGFTLLEILIVLGIIALIAGIGVGMMTDVFGDAGEVKAKTDVNTLQSALLRYKIKGGLYPTEAQGLQALYKKPTTKPQPSSWKPYVNSEKSLIDPWQQPYEYRNPGKVNTDSYDVFSKGPDMKAGTEDDIGNWQK